MYTPLQYKALVKLAVIMTCFVVNAKVKNQYQKELTHENILIMFHEIN